MTFADIWDVLQDATIETGNKIGKKARNFSKEDFLGTFGLEPKRGTMEVILPMAGFFTVGVLAGVGLGMLFAPKPGYELREDLSEQVKGAVRKAEQAATEVTKTEHPII
jgi:hypothetical protein